MLCNRLIDGFTETGHGDLAEGYAQLIPVRIIAAMLGVAQERADEFTGWVRGVLEFGLTDPVARLAARDNVIRFFVEQIAPRRANPTDDLISELLASEIDAKPVPDHQVIGTCNLPLMAGVDTTWSSIGASLWHLAQRPDHLARLELRVAVRTWLERIPEFELENPADVRWAGGQVRGPRHAPVVFTPGTRLG